MLFQYDTGYVINFYFQTDQDLEAIMYVPSYVICLPFICLTQCCSPASPADIEA